MRASLKVRMLIAIAAAMVAGCGEKPARSGTLPACAVANAEAIATATRYVSDAVLRTPREQLRAESSATASVRVIPPGERAITVSLACDSRGWRVTEAQRAAW